MIRPLGNNLLLEPIQIQQKSTIIVPEKYVKTVIAKVISIGPEVTDTKAGDVVLHGKYASHVSYINIKLDNDQFIAPASEILAVLEDYDGSQITI